MLHEDGSTMAPRSLLPSAFATVLLAACSTQTPTQSARDAELTAMTAVKSVYPGVLTGFDIQHGTTLVAAFDTEALDSMDEATEGTMKADVLKRWARAWSAQHPHRHATLTVRFIDFLARPESTETTKV